MELIFELLFTLVFHVLGWIIISPCMACLQAFFALCYPAKTWQMRRLQGQVLFVTSAGLSFLFLTGAFFWYRAPLSIVLIAAVPGYILLLLGGVLGRGVEAASHETAEPSQGKRGFRYPSV